MHEVLGKRQLQSMIMGGTESRSISVALVRQLTKVLTELESVTADERPSPREKQDLN
jgi:hypothetical protein